MNDEPEYIHKIQFGNLLPGDRFKKALQDMSVWEKCSPVTLWDVPYNAHLECSAWSCLANDDIVFVQETTKEIRQAQER